MRILVAGVNTARLLSNLKTAFQLLGHTCKSCTFETHKFYSDVQYDYYITHNQFVEKIFNDGDRMLCEPSSDFYHFVEYYDLFIFISCRTLLPAMLDLPILKNMGKKIIIKATGSDLRFVYPGSILWNYAECLFNMPKSDFSCFTDLSRQFKKSERFLQDIVYNSNLATKLYLTCMTAGYADVVSGGPAHTSLLTAPFFAGVNTFYSEGCIPFIPKRKKPIIVHAPSNEAHKGTNDILAVLRQLQSDNVDFELVQVSQMPNAKLKSLLRLADIVIDALACGGHGILANESMASGCLVLGINNPRIHPLPRNRPVVPITRKNLYEQIKRAVLDLPFRTRVAECGIAYIASGLHSPENSAEYLLSNLERAAVKDFDYYSTLFLDNPFWPDYKGYMEATDAKLYSPDGAPCPTHQREYLPDFVRTLLAKVILRHGAHPETDIDTFSASGLAGDKALQAFLVPRWSTSELTRHNPWLSVGPNAVYGFSDTSCIPYDELALST
ncbi:MAG: hypothetical protein LBR94_06205 [Desulfovibrio sp.]|jgi:hypothetical protein|nr:hypothetical protein [Desulfovibrio sp.]